MEEYICRIKDIIFSERNLFRDYSDMSSIIEDLKLVEGVRFHSKSRSNVSKLSILSPELIIQQERITNYKTEGLHHLSMCFMFDNIIITYEATYPSTEIRDLSYEIYNISDKVKNIVIYESTLKPFREIDRILLDINEHNCVTLKDYLRSRMTKSARN
jgi:hypothetical protein